MPPEVASKHPIKRFLVGSSCAMLSNGLLQPFDTVRTRLILSRDTSRNVPKSHIYKGMIATFGRILSEEGAYGLYKGTVPSIVRVGVGAGFYLTTIDILLPNRSSADHSKSKALFVGVGARAFAATVCAPLSVVKTRLENSNMGVRTRASHNVWTTLVSIYRLEGWRALYAGLLPTYIRDTPYAGIHMMFYTQIKQFAARRGWQDNSYKTNVAAGGISALCACTAAHPMDVIRTRMQVKDSVARQQGIISTIKMVFRDDGITGFWRGLSPRLVKRSVSGSIVWTLFEKMISTMGINK